MTDMKKHLGALVNSSRRCVVVMMTIPDREDHALIVEVDNLPMKVSDQLLAVLNSAEGQSANSFADALHRVVTPDGQNTLLSFLHHNSFMRAEPIYNIVMTPVPGQAIPLADIIKHLQGMKEASAQEPMIEPIPEVVQIIDGPGLLAEANRLAEEAARMLAEADRKREEAYLLDPSLKPASEDVPDVPMVTAEEVLNQLRK